MKIGPKWTISEFPNFVFFYYIYNYLYYIFEVFHVTNLSMTMSLHYRLFIWYVYVQTAAW